ncbi:alpha/beta hydrolase [Hirschia litorea]|uniref:Alpha/beta hydrolase n=1 Tax=Hirschia litorea TaxID=1199156 RepID=A0ABW2INS1_9PROT
MSDFVVIANNPAPEFAEIFHFQDAERNVMRGMYARASSRFKQSRGTVIVCPGRSEFIEKYFEVARDLQARGFCVVVFDWPGQGLSYRPTSDRLTGYIDHFDTYVHALRLGLNAIEDKIVGPLCVLAHSMGGAIALEALRQQVIEVEAAAFSAPLWGLKISKLTYPVIGAMNILGRGESRVSKHNLEEKFEGNIVTHDKDRWLIQQQLIAENSDLALGSVSWGWVQEVIKICKGFKRIGVLDHLTMPMLVASAEKEALVDNKSHRLLAERMKSAQHIEIAGANHELLMETDAKRDQFLNAFDKMLDRAGI